jgi:hypothetical protein
VTDPLNLPLKVAVLETKVATHEALLSQMAADIHAIRETVATAKGAWWGAGIVLGIMVAIAGGTGAMVHKLMS